MGSYKLKRLHLLGNYIEALERQNLKSCKDVLTLTRVELQSLLGINSCRAEKIHNIISRKCVSDPDSVYNLYVKQSSLMNRFFPSSLHSLDIVLQGGLLCGSLTEISGPPGVGKTQFCFMLSILATLPVSEGGLGGKVIYIDTESAFCAKRLKDMAKNRFPHLLQADDNIACFLQKIAVHKAVSTIALKEIIPNMEKDVIKNQVKLIIIDSIASLMRKEYGSLSIDSFMERNKILLEQAAVLKDLAQTYGIVVFLTNQITSHAMEYDSNLPDNSSNRDADFYEFEDFESGNEGNLGPLPPAEPPKKKIKLRQGVDVDHVIPAMGTTWSHCVNTRFVAQFLDPSVRQLTVAKSPVAPNASVRYIINETGIVLTDDDIEMVNIAEPQHQNILTKYNFLTSEVTGTGMVFSTDSRTNE